MAIQSSPLAYIWCQKWDSQEKEMTPQCGRMPADSLPVQEQVGLLYTLHVTLYGLQWQWHTCIVWPSVKMAYLYYVWYKLWPGFICWWWQWNVCDVQHLLWLSI